MYPHMSNMLFAIPLTGRPLWPDLMFAFHGMAFPMNWNHMALVIKGQPVADARNQFAQHAIENNCKYIFFLDEDVAAPSQTIPELIYKMEHTPDAAAIGGIYGLKREPCEPMIFRGNGNGSCWDWKAGEFFEVTGISMGCTMVRTEVFKDLKKPWFKTEFNYEKIMDGTPGLECWSEDLWFCQRVQDTGKWRVYADGSILCAHYDMTTGKPYSLPPDCKPLQHLRVPHGDKKILDLGSGDRHYETKEGSVIRVDEEKYQPDYRCDLRKLPFATGEYDVVFSSALERYPSDEIDEILTEWMRCLKPDGELRLVISDINWAAKEVAAGRVDALELFAGKRQSAFTFDSLKKILEEKEFGDIEKVASDKAHIAIRAKRTNGLG